jgi:hypothetical protein
MRKDNTVQLTPSIIVLQARVVEGGGEGVAGEQIERLPHALQQKNIARRIARGHSRNFEEIDSRKSAPAPLRPAFEKNPQGSKRLIVRRQGATQPEARQPCVNRAANHLPSPDAIEGSRNTVLHVIVGESGHALSLIARIPTLGNAGRSAEVPDAQAGDRFRDASVRGKCG